MVDHDLIPLARIRVTNDPADSIYRIAGGARGIAFIVTRTFWLPFPKRWEWLVQEWGQLVRSNHHGFTLTKVGALSQVERCLQESFGFTMEGASYDFEPEAG